MSSEAYKVILDLVKTRLPGALEGAITQELGVVLRQLCEKSGVWTEDVDVTVDSTSREFEIGNTEGTIYQLAGTLDEGEINVDAVLKMPSTLYLRRTPTKSQTLVATVWLRPEVRSPLKVPDWIFDKYQSVLVDGTLGMMMSQPAKPYASQQLAIFHLRKFTDGVAAAREEVMHGFGYRRQNWTFPQTFSVRR